MRMVVGVLAITVGLILAWVAPDDWVSGPGTITLSDDGRVVIDAPISIGSDDPIILTSSDAGVRYRLRIPLGVSADETIRASIAIDRDGTAFEPENGEIELRIHLPDGRDEAVPITGWDDEAETMEAVRRPSQGAAVVLGLLGLVVVLWVTEALPTFVTSLLVPVVLVFAGVAHADEATAPFFNPIIVLFFAGFLMAEAMRRAGLDHRLAAWITGHAGRSPGMLFASLLGVTAFLSMWMSNTAAVAVAIPIAMSVTAPLRAEGGFRRAVILGIAYAATIGGMGSAIGTPPNQLAIEFLDEFGGRSISFVDWFAFGLPMVVLLLPITGFYLWKRIGVDVLPERFVEARRLAREETVRLGKPTRDQWVIVGVFGAVAIGWVTQTQHGVHAGIVALAGAVVLFALGKVLPEDLGNISWPSLLTFGGGLTLGLFLVESGVSDHLATRLAVLSAVPSPLAVLAVATITVMLTGVASNTASAAILIPLAIPLAGVLGIDLALMAAIVAIAASSDFSMVIGTPPTMMAYSTGLYTAGQIFRTGIFIDLIGLALLTGVVTWIWDLIGVI